MCSHNWWNELPNDIRTVESLHIFHRKLKKHIFQRSYIKKCKIVILKWDIRLGSLAFLNIFYLLDSCSEFVRLNALIVSISYIYVNAKKCRMLH